MRKLKVLHAINNMGVGGAENLVSRILLSLDDSKFDCHLLLFEQDGLFLEEILRSKKVKVLTLKTSFRRFNPILLLEVISLIKKNEINIVHTHLYKSNLYVRLAAAIARCSTIVFHEHGGILRKPLRHRIAEAALQFFTDSFVFISNHDRAHFSRHSWLREKARKVVIPNPCIIDSAGPTKERGTTIMTVGMVGQLSQMKGQIFALRALAMLRKAGADLQVYLVGDGSEKECLEDFCHENGMTAHFPGNVLDVTSYYQMFDVLVHPSLSEGFGMVIVEAMSFGIPVIATKVGGIPEIITHGENGILVEPSSAEAIKEALLLLMSNNELRSKLSTRAVETYKEYYTFKNYIRQVESLYLKG